MVIYDHPEVRVIGQTRFSSDGKWKTNDWNVVTDADHIAEVAGRVCYMSYGKGRKDNSDYIDNIIKQGHESVLEHAVVTFQIKGISRSCSHELVRHRHLSFSQMSQRYVNDEINFVIPPALLDAPADVREDFTQYCVDVSNKYASLLGKTQWEGAPSQRKSVNEMARALLPNCTATNIIVTGNLRAWRHFCFLRGSKAADAEIRRLAVEIASLLKWVAPSITRDMKVDGDEITKVTH